MNIKNIILSMGIALILLGCGGITLVAMKPDAMSNIHSIAVFEMKEPPYIMMDLSSGTPWGAIAEKNRAEEIKPKFMGIINKEKFVFKDYLSQKVHSSLNKAGYKTYAVKVDRNAESAYIPSYEKYKNLKVDALLDIVPLGAGYTVQQPIVSSFWRSYAEVLVRVVDAKTGAILYEDRLMYGHHNPFISSVDLDAPKKYQFNEREDIFKAGDKVIIAGLKDGANQIAGYIGSKLRK